ncbi:MAG: YIP1 family protein, partial [Gemmatimonadaceae bacterium]|nr:YIP1 family protein [Gemmatimonadaceae bacterium]
HLPAHVGPTLDLAVRQGGARGASLPPRAVGAGREFAAYVFLGFSALSVPATAVLFGLILFLAGKLVSAPLSFGQASLVATLSTVPRVLGFLAMAVQGAVLDTSNVRSLFDASLGPARFLDPNKYSAAVMGLIAQVDVFNIWQFFICAIGIAVLARKERSTGFIAALIAFAITTAFQLIPQALA